MKIERIALHHLRMKLKSPFETSFGRIDTRDCLLLEVYTDGLVGYGECVADRDPGYSYETASTAWQILSDYIIPKTLHQDISDIPAYIAQVSSVRGHPMAKAGLEMALWDLEGKKQAKSLSQVFGGNRARVDVGVSVGIQESPDSLVKTAAGYLEQGYRRIKIKIKPGRDVSDTRAMRNAYPDLRLQVDANSAYTLETAPQLAPLDDLNLLLIEQPLAEDDIIDHSKLQSSFKTPICLDESIVSVRHTRQAIEMDACRIVNIKAGRVSGLYEAVAIHNYCFERSVPVWCGGMLETGVGRASNLALASLPGFTLPGDISATDRYYAEDITLEQFDLNADSTINVPVGPGLGVHLNQEILKKVSLRNQVFT